MHSLHTVYYIVVTLGRTVNTIMQPQLLALQNKPYAQPGCTLYISLVLVQFFCGFTILRKEWLPTALCSLA